jgi:hypothetical protein
MPVEKKMTNSSDQRDAVAPHSTCALVDEDAGTPGYPGYPPLLPVDGIRLNYSATEGS